MQLVAEGLACERGGRVLFQGLDFALTRGQALCVRGPNGAGKTSLLRLIAGLLAPSAGRIALEGAEGSTREAVHLVTHHDAVKPALTAAENLSFWRAVMGAEGAPVSVALEALGLGPLADFPARVLSAGQRRRLALARLVAIKRPVWLLDEPASNLDAQGQTTLARVLGDHLAEGGIAVVATHGAPDFTAAGELRLGTAE
jgi:heme exporter protein A